MVREELKKEAVKKNLLVNHDAYGCIYMSMKNYI